ncbi:MAG: Spy/CpxP family protein refolding chaperone [Candidatus Omnitrophica bacterium]|nr:Spy/CpxP family protein refolding chaperone [Candidatus Omnitrophota bacterium]
MKKILILTVALMVFGCACVLLAVEQGAGKGPGAVGEKVKQWKEMRKGQGEMGLGLYSRLDLTDEQKAKIQEIQKSRHEQISAIKQDETLSKEQKREKIKAIMESTQKQMDEVLTPEQKKKIEELRAEMLEKWKKRQQENKPTGN